MKQLIELAIARGWFGLGVLLDVMKAAYDQVEQMRPGVAVSNYPALPPAAVTVEAVVRPSEREASQEAIAQEEGAIAPPTPRVKSVPSRREVVEALLDQAWNQGKTTYPALIGYVQEQTGEACSRRTISNWKKERGLIDAA